MNINTTTPATYDGQLAARVADVLPDTDAAERLELLGVMDPDDLRASMAWLISYAPRLFDFALVRDLAMVERLMARLNEGPDDDEEPICGACGATIGVFHGRGDAWLHYTGQGTAASPVELFDAGHEPVIAWRLAGAR